jgi:uroporphyrinogen decarboxylase
VCRARNFLKELADYPAHAFSWATTEPGNPPLGQTPWLHGSAAGGISQETTLQQPSPDGVREEFQAALAATGGKGFILAPGCSIPPGTPAANLQQLREWSRAARPS